MLVSFKKITLILLSGRIIISGVVFISLGFLTTVVGNDKPYFSDIFQENNSTVQVLLVGELSSSHGRRITKGLIRRSTLVFQFFLKTGKTVTFIFSLLQYFIDGRGSKLLNSSFS